ncbi:DUF6089 family protein [Chitinophaga japonensis]|uniref:Outer membrane protein beta-barrel domain-containing protein n=1 Tax=Chitinophaga japonensis TaxID=104662 RepID=A0A562SPR0_CHIJA|nr:DUF6089 family protein [Chitinophaga japonensis]TWI82650.1 Outer membrane protein beta-barrel domain-containing protein [Chitinophaga japonensis]
MKKITWILLLSFLAPLGAFSQDWHVGGFAGITNYSGDLAQQRVDMRYTRPALGLMVKRDINRYLTLRLGFNWGNIAGADSTNESRLLQARNLSFRSVIWDLHFIGEFNFFDIYEKGYTPYVFAGIAGFSFYPTARDSMGNKVPLRRLGTEGQNLAEYPERTQYGLHQVAIPFGAGVKAMLNDRWTMGIEIGFRKTFTDYLDDVSKTYVDQATLLAGSGQQSVDFAWRGDEIQPKNGLTPGAYPPDGTIRGSDKRKDWYVFSGLTITYRLGSGSRFGRQKFSTCPKY